MPPQLGFLSILLAWTTGAWATDHNLPFMEYLDADRVVCLKWGFDELQGDITFQLTVNSTGWVGFGLSPQGNMVRADIVMGGYGPAGSYFADYYAEGNAMPLKDEEQSYNLLSMIENDGQTIMTFQRSIKTCDEKDFHITPQPIKLIYAYGVTDDIGYHRSRRGTKEVNLLNYMPRSNPPDAKYFTLKVENITVPSKKTYYHCKVMQLPDLPKKHHIYLVEPDIEHLDIVHHMLLYHCPSFVNEPYDKQCYMGDVGDACFGVVASWGVGGGAYELPENTGIPIGGESSDRFYRLEIHYNNPQEKEGITDSSGLRLYYTDKLRQHDVGVLTTGVLPVGQMQYGIPPRATQFHSYGICNTSLFSQLVNPIPDLQVFSVLLHTHLAGRKVRVGHFRNGKQIDFLGVNENYDFDMQEIVNLGSIKTVKPGDEIIVECTYNTEDRTKDTLMGLSTTDEMCLAFLFYYPAVDITSCTSRPNTLLLSTTTAQPDEYQSLMNNLPQIQYISDARSNYSVYRDGMVREVMKTPAAVCKSTNTASRPCSSWMLKAGGIILSLLLVALM
ncbi:PREDICTED: DBH-like monooxygenase protein 2 homolog [Cyprinodon variegatus]|uniref:Monooxygenase, DBH-like 1, like n=1 Tax=Cyprinodon variegatus TaxID=28743 RepID=A0A3Q2G670_CYPVA|nr:PREDICTED: DBH-like monooxygenase protein 2 homolog [Cyprinodon variegatus]